MKRIFVGLFLFSTFLGAATFGVQQVAASDCYFYADDVGYVCSAEPVPQQFVTPDIPVNSFLPSNTYGRLADNAWLYAEPSAGAAQVRNVGDGFLYSTIQGQVTNADGTWILVNPGEWVRAEDFTPTEQSIFQGVEIKSQPERPFGWIVGRDTYASLEPGGEPHPQFSQIERYTFIEIYDAIEVDELDQTWIWYNIGDGQWVRQTEVSLVDVSPRPEGVGENDFWTEIDLYEQSFAAYEGDRMVFATLISSGLNRWPTREGLFQVEERYTSIKMSGAEGQVDYYFVEDVPHTMFFDMEMEIALHGAYWHDRFGYKHSHGCVNMPPYDSEWVFNWSAEGPTRLWVNVHTSDPFLTLPLHQAN